MKNLSLILLLILFNSPVVATSSEEEDEPRPLVQVHVSVDMDAVNASLAATSESIGEISDSFRLMAETGQLDPDQQQQLTEIMQNLDQLLDATSASLDALPSLVQRSRDALVAQGDEFFSEFKFWTITFIVVLLATVIITVFGLYHFALRPLRESLTETAGNISDMVKALESTSKSLETNNQILRELLEADKSKPQ